MQGILSVDSKTHNDILLSHNEIIELQDYLLTPGLHTIQVSEPRSITAFLKQFLPLLHKYATGAYLSLIELSPTLGLTCLYRELETYGALGNMDILENYLLTSFYYDYLIIDGRSELINAAWFANFKNLLEKYKYISAIPVTIFLYN